MGIEHIYREIYNYIDSEYPIDNGSCHSIIKKLIENKIPIELIDGDHFFVCKSVIK